MESTHADFVPALPDEACLDNCRFGFVRSRAFEGVALRATNGFAPVCEICLAASRRARESSIETPSRRESGTAAHQGCTWDEIQDRLAQALTETSRGERELVWIRGRRNPSLADVIPERLSRLLRGATVVERLTPDEALARWCDSALESQLRVSREDQRAGLVVAWGGDESRVIEAYDQLVVVDSCRSAIADCAELWLPLDVGSDGALAIAALLELNGAAPRVPSEWTNERAVEATGLSPESVQDLIRRLRMSGSDIRFDLGRGIADHANSHQSLALIRELISHTGARWSAPKQCPNPAKRLKTPVDGKPAHHISSREFLSADRDPTRDVVIIDGGDPLIEWPESTKLAEYLMSAGSSFHLSPSRGATSDRVRMFAPTLGQIEGGGVVGFADGALRFGYGIAPERFGRSRPEEIVRRALVRVGIGDAWFRGSLAEEWGDLQPTAESSARTRLDESLSVTGFKSVKESRRSSPQLFTRYPLQLSVVSENRSPTRPLVVIADEDARERGITRGAHGSLFNDRGRLEVAFELDASQPRGILGLRLGMDPEGRTAAELFEAAPGLLGCSAWGTTLVEAAG